MVKFTLSTLSALALALPFVADLPFASATHTNGISGSKDMRRHHARMATKHINFERSSLDPPRNAVLAKKMDKVIQKKASPYKIRKRGDGKVCRIRGSSHNSTSTLASSSVAYSSSASASIATGTAAYSSGASSAWSSVLPTNTDGSSSAASSASVGNSWDVVTSSAIAQASSSAQASSPSSEANTWTSIKASSTSTSAAAAQTSTSSGSGSGYTGDYAHLIPNGKKAGISAGDSFDHFQGRIGWWYNWEAESLGHSAPGVTGMNMLWGAGSAGGTDQSRLAAFKSLSSTPAYIIGYEEPDCPAGSGSAGFDVQTGINLWNELVGPWAAKGSILIGPSMCKQAAESGWLEPFMEAVHVKPTVTNVHINKNSREGIMADLDHYASYGLPMIVTEFACVNDVNGFVPSEDQAEINNFIEMIVEILENDPRVIGYAFSSGDGLGGTWKLVSSGSTLSESGQAYLNAISKYN
ncbi:hypothetical protein QFC22_006017 [Naganishia vaughanmartiniae]|uniref:Uncharacterized protein n=1 Tax=Naganishia vaughanmartiniae TaxID=1424756 RepID=A0ACC2WP35_9TREE|nr:hypothetical protein QFC22_006017 [Naganishia vaughanmartiniae]